ncbi:MAG: putative Histidine kinase [Candidatus Saccharibacteria bacterium]|nr:putative Histidine kinase [Candidatus Saccharibacteria bacterium]
MRTSKLKTFVASPTAGLAATYLAIIMILSIGFSLVFYNASSHALYRQVPPHSFYQGTTLDDNPNRIRNDAASPQTVESFLHDRADEGRKVLLTRLVLLNIGALLAGSVVSYLLARRTLEPIEEAMEAQVQFVSDASHELRTPLTAIQTSNEVALRNPRLTLAQAKQLIGHNTEDVRRLKELSDGLLNLAQHNKTIATLVAVQLQDITSEAMTQVVQQATAKNIAVEDTTENLTVLADKPGLAQVLVILLDNAVKYSNPGGTVYLETQVKGKQAMLMVRDEGMGIRASDMPHLFRRFYRADNARTAGEQSGYGLGLAIAKQIMTNQNGNITVISTPGTGSTFTLLLTLAQL